MPKGKQEGEEQAEILNIPCTLQKIATLPHGGHRLTFDAPETAAPHVRELIGRENNTVFLLCLIEASKVDKKEGKCQSTRKHLTFRNSQAES